MVSTPKDIVEDLGRMKEYLGDTHIRYTHYTNTLVLLWHTKILLGFAIINSANVHLGLENNSQRVEGTR